MHTSNKITPKPPPAPSGLQTARSSASPKPSSAPPPGLLLGSATVISLQRRKGGDVTQRWPPPSLESPGCTAVGYTRNVEHDTRANEETARETGVHVIMSETQTGFELAGFLNVAELCTGRLTGSHAGVSECVTPYGCKSELRSCWFTESLHARTER